VTHREPEEAAIARRRIHQVEASVDLDQLAKVLCVPARRRIVEALMTAGLSVSDLASAIDRTVASTSQHLRVLRELGMVEPDRQGRTVFYRLRPVAPIDQVRAVLGVLADPEVVEGTEHDGTVRRSGRRRR